MTDPATPTTANRIPHEEPIIYSDEEKHPITQPAVMSYKCRRGGDCLLSVSLPPFALETPLLQTPNPLIRNLPHRGFPEIQFHHSANPFFYSFPFLHRFSVSKPFFFLLFFSVSEMHRSANLFFYSFPFLHRFSVSKPCFFFFCF